MGDLGEQVVKELKKQRIKEGVLPQVAETRLNFSSNALLVLQKRYLKKNNNREVIETPEECFKRIADTIAAPDLNYNKSKEEVEELSNKFYDLMVSQKFMPNSPTIMNAGKPDGQLSACFVLPLEDSMDSIFETLKNTALIHKTGGGTGFPFYKLRSKNQLVRSSKGSASGPLSFLKTYNAATETVKQGGTRRGANMAVMKVDHPEIKDFIHCKENEYEITNFNISVALTDKFLEKLAKDEEFELVQPHTGEISEKVSAKELFEEIVDCAWRNGEPGILFLDRINETNPTHPRYFKGEGNPPLGVGLIEATNPCGEQPLLPYESCNLGSINLAKFVKNSEKPEINYESLEDAVRTAVHFLDNVIDANSYPLEIIDKTTKANRKIGLGVMGFADMLVKLNIPYNSEKAVKVAEDVMKHITETARQKSVELGKERGSFPNFPHSVYAAKGYEAMRNATVTTIAPTGSISMIADCSSGIEPLFALAYIKNVMDNTAIKYTTPALEERLKKEGIWNEKIEDKIISQGNLAGIEEIPDEIKKVFVTSGEISPEWHIRILEAFQKYTDNAVSKTINFPNSATREDIKKAYLLAAERGIIKGLTVYRDGSREEQVLYAGLKDKKSSPKITHVDVEPPKALDIKHATKYEIETPHGKLHITIVDELRKPKEGVANEDELIYFPYEIFENIGPIGSPSSVEAAQSGMDRSYFLQAADDPDYVKAIRNWKSVTSNKSVGYGENRVSTITQATGIAFEYHLLRRGIVGYEENGALVQLRHKKDYEVVQGDELAMMLGNPNGFVKLNVTGNKLEEIIVCPQCGSSEYIVHEAGCGGITCKAPGCGYSDCS